MVALLVPPVLSVLAWLAWWTRRGRFAALSPLWLIAKACGTLFVFWFVELVAVALGLVLVMAAAEMAGRYADPGWDWGVATPIALLTLPTVLLGWGIWRWLRKEPAIDVAAAHRVAIAGPRSRTS
jgi:hypothetical protein